jgi:glycosyltransferase involved in cell wall biosynthesis
MFRLVILLSIYNGEKYLEEFLESLCRQSYRDFHVLVRDDGSSDESRAIVNGFRRTLSISILNDSENLGPAKSFMRLLEAAGSGYDIYMFADQDDWWYPDKVSRCVEFFRGGFGNPMPILYFTSLELVDDSLKNAGFSRTVRVFDKANSLVENVVTGCTMGINSAARNRVLQALPESYSMHDWWINLVVSFFGEVHFDDRPSIKYRQHASNSIGAATTFFEEQKRRVQRLLRGLRPGVYSKSQQAQAFLATHGASLSVPDRRLVELVSAEGKSLGRSFYLFFFSPFPRQRRFDGILLRFLFLFGRY